MSKCPFPGTMLGKQKGHEGEDPGNVKEQVEFGGWGAGEQFQKDQQGDCQQRKARVYRL